MSEFERKCKTYPGNCYTSRTIHIVGPGGADAEYQNLYITENGITPRAVGGTIHRDDLMALRDALNIRYPIKAAFPPRDPFRAVNSEVKQGQWVWREDVYVTACNRHVAEHIAEVLNKALKKEAA